MIRKNSMKHHDLKRGFFTVTDFYKILLQAHDKSFEIIQNEIPKWMKWLMH